LAAISEPHVTYLEQREPCTRFLICLFWFQQGRENSIIETD